MDWNWYFSSLAQSAAAIVGIFCAFIVTKILSNESVFRQKIIAANELIIGANKIHDDAEDLCIAWFIRRTNEMAFAESKEMITKGIYDAEQIYEKCNFSSYVLREYVLTQINKFIERRFFHIKNKDQDIRSKSESSNGSFSLPFDSVRQSLSMMHNPALQYELNKEKESIDRVIRGARHQIRLISTHLAAVQGNPESSPQISYTLILVLLLFVSGVIYPLSFLLLPAGALVEFSFASFSPLSFSLKGTLLAIVLVIFLIIVSIFFHMNFTMKYPQHIIDSLKLFVNISSYSEYFHVMDINSVAISEKAKVSHRK